MAFKRTLPEAMRPKALRGGYAPRPFFYLDEEFDGNPRFVAWTDEFFRFHGAIGDLLSGFGPHLEMLVKYGRTRDDDFEKRLLGSVKRQRLLKVWRALWEWFVTDGSLEWCVRDPETGDYFAHDDHGILFLYFATPAQRETLLRHGFNEQREPLISSEPHWHVVPGNAEEALNFLLSRVPMQPYEAR